MQIQGHTLEEQDELSADFQDMVVAALHRVTDKLALQIARDVAGRTGLIAAGPADDVIALWDDEVPELIAYLDGVYDAGALEAASEMAVGLDVPDGMGIPGVPNSFALEYLQQATNRLSGVGDELWENIRDEITVGLANGETTNEIAARIQSAAGFTEARAKTVARTELVGASNAGTHMQVLMIVPDAMKEWVATTDGRTRFTHRHADGQKVPVDQAFSVGGSMLRWPGDPGGAAGEVVNCRCTLIFAVDDDAQPEIICDPTVTAVSAASVVNMLGSSCTCAVTIPEGPTGVPKNLTNLQHDEVYSAFMGSDPISPAYGGAKIFKKLAEAKSKLATHPDLAGLSEHEILAIVDEIYKGKKFTFTEKFDEWLSSTAGKKAAPNVKKVAKAAKAATPPKTAPTPVPTPPGSPFTYADLGPDMPTDDIFKAADAAQEFDVIAESIAPNGVPLRLVVTDTHTTPSVHSEYWDNGWISNNTKIKNTASLKYEHPAIQWHEPHKPLNVSPSVVPPPPGPVSAVTGKEMDSVDVFLSLVDTATDDGDVIAIGKNKVVDIQYRLVKRKAVNGMPYMEMDQWDPLQGKWHSMGVTIKHQNDLDAYTIIDWSEPLSPKSTGISTSSVVTVTPPVSPSSVTLGQKNELLHLMKAKQPITPGWGGAKVYKQLEQIKLQIANKPEYAGLTDRELLQLMDDVAPHATSKTYESVVTDWLNTPAGKKYAGGGPDILDKPKSGSVTSTPAKAVPKTATPAMPTTPPPVTNAAQTIITDPGDISGYPPSHHTYAFKQFKTATTGSYLSDSPQAIFDHLSEVVEQLQQKSGFEGITPKQLLRLIDEHGAKNLGVPNKHLFEKKITEWLQTPAGKKYANDVANGVVKAKKAAKAAKKATPSSSSYSSPSSYSKPNTPELSSQVQNAKPTSTRTYENIYATEVRTMHNEMMAQQGEWTAAQKSSLRTYTGSSYHTINNCLRGKGPCSEQTLKHIKNAQAGMRRSTRNIVLRRGTNADEFPGFARSATLEQLKSLEGRELQSDSFLSSSFGDSAAFGGNILIEFHAPAGTPMAYVKDISHFESENEILLGAGMRYVVESVTRHNSYQTLVKVRVIVP